MCVILYCCDLIQIERSGIKYSLTYFSTEESVALWAQWVKVPSTPDKRSPCPPHLRGDPSAVHTKAEKSRKY